MTSLDLTKTQPGDLRTQSRALAPRSAARLQRLLACALSLFTVAWVDAADAAESVVGRTTAEMAWAPSAGVVAGYEVYVSSNGDPFPALPSTIVTTPSVTVTGAYGDWLRVRVIPMDAVGGRGPASADSDLLIFARSAADLDEDGILNASDLCARIPDPAQADRDADGVGDACDPCTRLAWSYPPVTPPDQDPRRSILKLGALLKPGLQTVVFSGFYRPTPGGPPFSPNLDGVQLQLGDASGSLAALDLPPADSAITLCDSRAGWRRTPPGWSFRSPTKESVDGRCVTTSGRARFSVRFEDRGGDGMRFVFHGTTLALDRLPALPVSGIYATLSPARRADPDEATLPERTGACAEARYVTATSRSPSDLPVCRAIISPKGLANVACRSR